jgi:uncharacterized membrane protein YbaN (DUF454 family)
MSDLPRLADDPRRSLTIRTASRAGRLVYLALGWAFFALGAIGAVLPLLPTTPFMLLALGAFARGSTRLETWLLDHRWFGPRLRAWRRGRVVPWSVKITAWVTMAISMTVMIVMGRASGTLIAVTGALMAVGVLYVASCPSRPPAPPPGSVPDDPAL